MAPNTTSQNLINPNESLQIPKWINEEYFHKILDKDVPNYAKILNFTPIAATAPGENYTSIMVRVAIDLEMKDGTQRQMSYILKTTLDSKNPSAAILNSMNLFPKEKQMYQTLLPQFEQLYREAGVNIRFGPKCLHIEETPEGITLVMEDLKRRKFANIDRLQGFNFTHMQRVLHKLAEFHAASAVYYELNGPYDEVYKRGLFNEENRALFEGMAVARNAIYVNAMREWNLENIEEYIAKIPSPRNGFDEALRVQFTDPDEFNVLNHGDCWANNIMFNYKQNGDIDETLFVDFQIGKWGSPAQDLWYVIVTSAALDVKTKEFDKFIAIYYKRLIECLKLLNYTKPLPTLKQLHIMMIKYGFWGLLTANGVMVAVLLPSDKDANMETMLRDDSEGDAFKLKAFTNTYYARAMCQLLPFFNNKGILDIPNNALP